MSDQPNIILVHSDQHRYDCLGSGGHSLLRTPHLDRLAAEGVSFTHAFTPAPVCVPARNSLLHGQWPSRHQAIANAGTEVPVPKQERLPSFSEALRRAGYRLGYVGKWGIHPGETPEDYGFHDYVPAAGYAAWRQDQGLPPAPRRNTWFGEADPHIRPEQSRVAWEADEVLRLLASYAEGHGPFLIRWDPSGPHPPNVVPEPYASMYPPRAIPPWPGFPDPLAGKPYIQGQQRRSWGVEGWGWEEWAPVVAYYLGDITLMDAQIGRVLEALDGLGLARDTLVVYTTDHGDMRGSHGMMDKHFVMYDDVVRVPLLLRWPACVPAGGHCDAFVSHAIDLATTLCRAASAPVPETFRGRDLLSLPAGEDGGRPDIYAAYYGSQFGLYSQRMVRDRRWKYVWNATAEDELYDLAEDPGELANLAQQPACRDHLVRLRARLVAWMEETDDRLLNEWTRAQLLEGRK